MLVFHLIFQTKPNQTNQTNKKRLDSVIERTLELLTCCDPIDSDSTKKKLKKAGLVNAVLHDSLFNMEIHHLSRTIIEEIFHQVYNHLNAILFNYIIKNAQLFVSSSAISSNTNYILSSYISYWSTSKAQNPYLADIARYAHIYSLYDR